MRRVVISLFVLVFIYSFTSQDAPNTFTDNRDGKVYKTVTLGAQVWMAENLAYLPAVSAPSSGSYTEPYYYVYGYDGTDVAAAKATINYQTYGVLYNWPAAKTGCPEGWHLPSDEEWIQLEMYLGMTQEELYVLMNLRGTDEGGKLKEAGTSHWNGPNTGATNSSGFTALPCGVRLYGGSFGRVGLYGYWWSSTKYDTYYTWYRCLKYNDSSVYRSTGMKEVGLSVRCVRD
ncbi:MAG: FISUMP domain-containing protein [Candidatus Paceibacterota bacterium]|jgi:uncharacterized protein (TIGR02145 family)